MPLTGSEAVYTASLRAALLAEPDAMAVDGPALTALCRAISTTIIPHIIANGLVNVTVATTGTAAAQTGTGVGAIT